VPTKAWKQAVIGQRWALGESLVAGIGQGFVLTTPLQLAVMTARLANGGLAVEPRLVRGVLGENEPAAAPPPAMGLPAAALELVQRGMDAVVNGPRGTARKAALDGPVRMAGKTGTAQVRRITKAERAQGGKLAADTPWEERDHSLFVAYAPVESPRYASALVIEHGGSGGNAALLTKEIMTEVLRRNPAEQQAVGRLAGRSNGGGSA
jgi:penicillin-binding protein 2